MGNIAISIRLTHPTIDPEWITAGMGLPPTRVEATCWSRDIAIPPDYGLEEALQRAMNVVRPARGFLGELIEGGGSAELFVRWFHGPGATLDHETLRELADLGLDLALDVYLAPMSESGDA